MWPVFDVSDEKQHIDTLSYDQSPSIMNSTKLQPLTSVLHCYSPVAMGLVPHRATAGVLQGPFGCGSSLWITA